MIENHPFYHSGKNVDTQYGVFETYPHKSHIFVSSGSGHKILVQKPKKDGVKIKDVVTLRFTTDCSYYEKKVIRDPETKQLKDKNVKHYGVNQHNYYIGIITDPQTNAEVFTLLDEKDAKVFTTISELVETYFPDLRGGILKKEVAVINRDTRDIEKDPAFYPDQSQDGKVRKGEVGSYLWRPSSRLDKGPEAPERYYVLVHKTQNGLTNSLFKFEYMKYVSTQNMTTKVLTKITHCSFVNSVLREEDLVSYSINDTVKDFAKDPKPILNEEFSKKQAEQNTSEYSSLYA